jgi:hypothetical protein
MGSNPSVPKSREVIQDPQKGGQLSGQERKMLNFLLAVAYPNLTTAQRHCVTTADVRAYLGSHESNDRIRAIFRKLGHIIPDVSFIDTNGEEMETFGGLVFGKMPKGEGIISYFFHLDLLPLLSRPAVFARIKLAILGQFVSKYAPMLYENLELYANRDFKVWDIAVDELRSLLGIGDKMIIFTEFRKRVLSPALAEINDKADFTVTLEEVRAKRGTGRKVERLIFTVTIKPEREAEEAELRHKLKGAEGQPKPDKARDADTVDAFDGRTDRERGGVPMLKLETIEQARALFDDWGRERPDVDQLERDWRSYETTKTERVRNADKAFLGWLKRWKENRRKSITND